MKTNHQRNFKDSKSNLRRCSDWFKSASRNTFRNKARIALQTLNARDPDEVIFPTRNAHGEDIWND
ncbi:MAG: hypothetical protein E6R04_01120 [Spirochaetes bacterium]|nr:MAG: hypothetical protein E6R04_01120 [Spirochaetota bacterium]